MPTDSNAAGAEHYKAAGQLSLHLYREAHHSFRECSARARGVTDQDDAAGLMGVGKDKLTEIFVFGQENTLLANSQVHDRCVIRTGCQLCDRAHIMARGAERTNDRKIAAFVGKEAHRLASSPFPEGRRADEDRFFMRHGVGGISDGGLDVGLGQSGVGIE